MVFAMLDVCVRPGGCDSNSQTGARIMRCLPTVATTLIGSENLPSRKAHGPTPAQKQSQRSDLLQSISTEPAIVERFFNKIKQSRRVATRYDKLAANYLAFVQLASIRLWLRSLARLLGAPSCPNCAKFVAGSKLLELDLDRAGFLVRAGL
jgi:hypothetical protein